MNRKFESYKIKENVFVSIELSKPAVVDAFFYIIHLNFLFIFHVSFFRELKNGYWIKTKLCFPNQALEK